jgi:mono/diheme cytochrome c family protein
MSQPNDNIAKPSDSALPAANRAPASILLIGAFALLIYWSMAYLDAHGGGFDKQVYWPYQSWAELDGVQVVDPVEELRKKGKLIFANYCAVCHQPTGLGVPGQYPPLAGSDWVTEKDPTRLINLVLNSVQGPIKVSGQTFNLSGMIAGKQVVTKDEDMAAILTFIRGNKAWGNNAGPVTPEQVKDVRDKTASRSTPFSADELMKIPVTAPDAK